MTPSSPPPDDDCNSEASLHSAAPPNYAPPPPPRPGTPPDEDALPAAMSPPDEPPPAHQRVFTFKSIPPSSSPPQNDGEKRNLVRNRHGEHSPETPFESNKRPAPEVKSDSDSDPSLHHALGLPPVFGGAGDGLLQSAPLQPDHEASPGAGASELDAALAVVDTLGKKALRLRLPKGKKTGTVPVLRARVKALLTARAAAPDEQSQPRSVNPLLPGAQRYELSDDVPSAESLAVMGADLKSSPLTLCTLYSAVAKLKVPELTGILKRFKVPVGKKNKEDKISRLREKLRTLIPATQVMFKYFKPTLRELPAWGT
jgi:hypothetical protein